MMVSQLHVNGDPSDLFDLELLEALNSSKGTNNDIIISESLNSIVTITFGCK
jgi:hypothetical protein